MAKSSWQRLLSRRKYLILSLGSFGAVGAFFFSKSNLDLDVSSVVDLEESVSESGTPASDIALAKQSPKRTASKPISQTPLKQRAKLKGLIYGALPQADEKAFARDRQFQSILIRECGLIVAGFYWHDLRPSPDSFDFAVPDYFAKFAAQHKMLLRGHPLVWHMALPQWFATTVNRENAKQLLSNHIQTVVGRYRGRMHSWDVVNEAFNLEDGRADGLRKTPWLEFLGSDYIELAFRMAAKADPKALLVYNDYGLEGDDSASEAKRRAVLTLLKRLKSRGTPIHALGIQSHLSPGQEKFNPAKFRQFLREVGSLGLKVIISELDVVDKYLPGDIKTRDRLIAKAYQDYLTAALAEKSVIAVINWGLTDRHTWLSDPIFEFARRSDGLAVRPLPFDRNFKPKLAWYAIARALDKAPKR
jgi:endo-1,4-beta-xylanase